MLEKGRRMKKISAFDRLALAEALFNWIPHPTQRLWLLSEHKVKVAACGRRWGKTEAQAVDAATYALSHPGTSQMIVAPTYDQSRLIVGTVEKFLLDCAGTRDRTKVAKTPYPRIEFCESVITARTADEDGRNLRGHSSDRIIIDEAAFVRDAVVEEVISPMLADRDGQLILISTPFGKNHFWRAYQKGARSGRPTPAQSEAGTGGVGVLPPVRPLQRCASFRFPSWENPNISREYIEYQRSVLTERQFAVEYEAEFLDDQAAVFPWDDIQRAIALGNREETCIGYRTAGIDWARYSDFTVVAVVDTQPEGSRLVAIDRFNKMAWEDQIERTSQFLTDHRVSAVLTDQTSIGDPLLGRLRESLWQRESNIKVDGYVFTNSSKRELIDDLVLKLAHGQLALLNHEQLIRELQHFEYETTESGNIRMNARTGYTDDCVIALALASLQAGCTGWGRTFLSGGKRASGDGGRRALC